MAMGWFDIKDDKYQEVCIICEAAVNFPTDHPLHVTNWNLPDLRTYSVCSKECQKILFDRYDLEQRVKQQQVRKRYANQRNRLDQAVAILQGYSTDTSDSDVETLCVRLYQLFDD